MDLKKTAIGIEFGTTRIKAVLINSNHEVIASGQHVWENRLVNDIWTYYLEDITGGLQSCFNDLMSNFRQKYSIELSTTGAIGVSAMMHGYMPFDSEGNLLTNFRTWRNSMTEEASKALTELFSFHIPQRWTIAHLYQAILNGEEHVENISYLTTLAGYVHWRLTGCKVVGTGEASGIVPLNLETLEYDESMIEKFRALIADKHYSWDILDILPKGIPAGNTGGVLTNKGALLLDPTGVFKPGVPVAPCEGDADTGMVATNSVRPGVGNVSAGTSAFFMIVADKKLKVHREVDMFCAPNGALTAMVHSSNCTSDINSWVNVFAQFAEKIGSKCSIGQLYEILFKCALSGDFDAGGLVNYNYFSGESIPLILKGRPLFVRTPDSNFTLDNFMRSCLMSAISTMKIGMDILNEEEHVTINKVYAHGGYFKTEEVGQRILSAAVGKPVTIMKTAGEGGPFGMALLCAYMLWKNDNETLEEYLDNKVFNSAETSVLEASEEEKNGFTEYVERYKAAMDVERLAVNCL